MALYSGGSSGNYERIFLSGTLPDELDGYGAISFDVMGLQNGGSPGENEPDGIGLASSDGIDCIEFISYEGTMTAARSSNDEGGSACDGVESIDVGVYEVGDNPDQSIQKRGQGEKGSDFYWTGPAQATPDSLNIEQIIGELIARPETTLFGTAVKVGTPQTPQYDRPYTWLDEDDDCISDRHEILIAQHIDDDEAHPLVMSGCYVDSGKWYDAYEGEYYYFASQVQIDHVVALYDAWYSGLGNLSSDEQSNFANVGTIEGNSLPETSHEFLAVGAISNSEKSNLGPTEWMPREAYHCTYLKKIVLVKSSNELYFTQGDYDFIKAREDECGSDPLPELPPNEQ